MRVLIAGATGYIGRAVVAECKARGWDVVALVRPSPDGPAEVAALAEAKLLICDPCNHQALSNALAGESFDVVVSCLASRSGQAADAQRVDLGANCNLLEAVHNPAHCHFVLLSAICVQRPRLPFQFAKLAFEDRLKRSGMRYSIVRPTAYFKSLAGQLQRVSRGGSFLVFGNGRLTACKPISEADLARFIADCPEKQQRHNAVLPIGGPGPALTPEDQAELLSGLLDRPVRLRRVPLLLMDSVIALLTPLGKLLPGLRERADFARIGRYYASESMLVWDPAGGAYSAEQTPETGSDTLEEFYRYALQRGLAGQELGEQAFFEREP